MSLNRDVHKKILVRILKNIFAKQDTGPFLGFKGGTAAFLFYGLDRFSVDLDFDLLDEDRKNQIYNSVSGILQDYGRLKDKEEKKHNLFYLLSYNEKIAGAQNVKVEINLRNFGSRYEIKSYIGIPMKVMVKEDMAAHKLCAMSERLGKTNRDIFDVYFFLKNNWPVNKGIVEKRTGLMYKEFLQRSISSLEKATSRNILSGMGELLDNKQKAWVKKNLINETIFLLKLALEEANAYDRG
jgi:predicted nucleotidyltransferase component of viral defense system